MIEWLRDKFASAITFFFVVAVILCTICGGISGYTIGKALGGYYNNYGGIGCLIGLAIGLFLGIISGILSFGFFATIIHISETCDSMVSKLDRLYSSQNNFSQNVSTTASNEKTAYDDIQYKPWTCTKCGTKNPILNTKCTNCGNEKQ